MKLFLALTLTQGVASFQPLPWFTRPTLSLASSVGGGKPPPEDNGRTGNFLDEFGKEESDGLRKAREYLSDESLPISYECAENMNNDDGDEFPNKANEGGELAFPTKQNIVQDLFAEPNEALIRNNPYMKVVSSLTPSDLISKFTKTAHPRVQNAVRSTILGLIGSLPKMAFDTTTITTGERLASVMFQLQMTGYLFKNAEYRLSLSQSLGSITPSLKGTNSKFALSGSEDDDEDDDEENKNDPLKGKVKGKLKIRYGKKSESDGKEATEPSAELEVDAAAYMSELRSELSQLRDELTLRRKEQEEAIRKDLLLYIRTLPEQQLRSLTNTISPDVLIAMKGLVNVVMAGIGEGQIGPDTVTEQSGEAMAQLCMWQLVVGYNLRELEVREEMKNSMREQVTSAMPDAGVDFSGPGAFD